MTAPAERLTIRTVVGRFLGSTPPAEHRADRPARTVSQLMSRMRSAPGGRSRSFDEDEPVARSDQATARPSHRRRAQQMTIKVDPEENEIGALFDFVDLDGGRVLEIGSGDCRLTWRYADRVEQVTAVEPFGPAITRARQQLPRELEGQVVLRQVAFEEFAAQAPASAFDVAIFSWSLCCIEPDRMVPALEEVHRSLRPSGTLIDIHPVSGRAQVEV